MFFFLNFLLLFHFLHPSTVSFVPSCSVFFFKDISSPKVNKMTKDKRDNFDHNTLLHDMTG